jgi:hypothetical protein
MKCLKIDSPRVLHKPEDPSSHGIKKKGGSSLGAAGLCEPYFIGCPLAMSKLEATVNETD